MNNIPPMGVRELPAPLNWKKMLGVGVVVVGMAMGTGELIMWPHLVTRYGLAILWLGLVGITIQYFINQEVSRHTLATGESFFTSSARVLSYSPLFWMIAAILLYVWPAWATALGTILSKLIGVGNYMIWSWFSLILVLVITFSGKTAYRVLETTLKVTVPTFFVLLTVISFSNLNLALVGEALRGVINFGYVPVDVDWSVLLGAVVFAGAGGMLNLCVSLWSRDKQLGMAHYVGKIANPISGKLEAVSVTGNSFPDNAEQRDRWKGWMQYIRIDQGLIFWFLGFITLFLLSVNAYAVLSPRGIVPNGLDLVSAQALIFSTSWGKIGEVVYLLMAYLMLFSVMWTVLDALTRIVSDIVHTNSRVGALMPVFHKLKHLSIHHLYYGLMFCFVLISALLVPFQQPFVLLVITSVLGGLTTAIYIPVILYINNVTLPKYVRPGWITNIVLAMGGLFYWYFVWHVASGLIA